MPIVPGHEHGAVDVFASRRTNDAKWHTRLDVADDAEWRVAVPSRLSS